MFLCPNFMVRLSEAKEDIIKFMFFCYFPNGRTLCAKKVEKEYSCFFATFRTVGPFASKKVEQQYSCFWSCFLTPGI
jgi:hypothetical protein